MASFCPSRLKAGDVDRTLVSGEFFHHHLHLDVPDFGAAIFARGGEHPATGRIGHTGDAFLMRFERHDRLAGGQVGDDDVFVPAARRHLVPIGGEADAVHWPLMITHAEALMGFLDVVDDHGAVRRDRGDRLLIFGEGHGRDAVGHLVRFIERYAAIGQVEKADIAVLIADDRHLAALHDRRRTDRADPGERRDRLIIGPSACPRP